MLGLLTFVHSQSRFGLWKVTKSTCADVSPIELGSRASDI